MSEDNIQRLKALREDYRKVFTSEEGKRVLADLSKICMYNSTTFVPNDPYSMAFNEGNRNIGNRLLGLVNAVSPEAFPLMMKESKAADEDLQ